MESINGTLERIKDLDGEAMRKAQKRMDCLTKPQGSLGVMEEMAVRLAGIFEDERPRPGKKVVIVMAADHGVAEEGVSLYPSEVTAQMVLNFLSGGAAINVLARHAGAEVRVVDIGVRNDVVGEGLIRRKVKPGTSNLAHGAAMTREEAVAALRVGIEVAEAEINRGARFLAAGDMGIGNTTAASAITACISGLDPSEVTGRGTGLDDRGLERKIKVIRRALQVNRPNPADPLDVLSKVGGLEIAGIAGLMLAAAAARRPVLVDGFISGAAALVASGLQPKSTQYMIASHLSVERGHRIILDKLGLRPVIHADMRLGEGTGAALAFNILDAALKILNEMATFEEAGVSGPQ